MVNKTVKTSLNDDRLFGEREKPPYRRYEGLELLKIDDIKNN